MNRKSTKVATFLLLVFASAVHLSPTRLLAAEGRLLIEPTQPTLLGAESQQQLLITHDSGEQLRDVTDGAVYSSLDPKIATVSEDGIVRPVGNGKVTIEAQFGGLTSQVEVTVAAAGELLPLHFARDIIPLLSKAGCNAGSCHGKQGGQNGFALSVFGFDPQADYEALVSEGHGRRLFPSAPEHSLLLTKAINRVPHGGGRRIEATSQEYRRLLRWVESGMPRGADDTPQVVRIEVSPQQRVMTERATQRMLVTAFLNDGNSRDVTHEALYSSNDDTLARVDMQGRIATGMLAGEAAIVARYREHVASCRVTVPMNKDASVTKALAAWDRTHFVDRLVAEKWQQLHILPSEAAAEATLHRRLYLDLIGRLPTPEESAAYLANTDPQKHVALVDSLLARPDYADYWAVKWADLLRINRDDLGAKAAYQYHQWLRDSLRENKPYDVFVRELLTAQGSSNRNQAVNFYKAFPKPDDLSIAVSQVFLGVRLECARCHHHPYENWGQEDFYGLAAFFPRVQTKKGAGVEQFLYITDKGDVKHPRTQQVVQPQVLLGDPLAEPPADPRQHLAEWMTRPDNPFLPRAVVNRIWAQLMGRGLVEPLDDMRDTNPATNEPLLAALVTDFVEHDFDLKHLLKTIATSRVYGLSSQPNATNARDTQNYSRAYRKRLAAEVLLDAICDVTAVPETLAGLPPGTRAVQSWDHRLPSRFLDTFGRPQRKTVCECERVSESTLSQVLHLMNGELVTDKITDPTGRAAHLAGSEMPPAEIITELYLAAYGRPPREEELTAAQAAFARPDATRRTATEDILWALLNSAEFVLNH